MNDAKYDDELCAALDEVASWLIAAYGARLEGVSLSLEGYYGPVSECYGVVPITLIRGVRPDGASETRETLPTREIQDYAEGVFHRLVPSIRCTRNPARDVRHVASSSLIAARDVSAHRRIKLLATYGGLSTGG